MRINLVDPGLFHAWGSPFKQGAFTLQTTSNGAEFFPINKSHGETIKKEDIKMLCCLDDS
jgi:hypothetical protein